MTNQEMLLAAIEFEEVEFAADLFYLMQEGYIDANSEYTLSGQDWNKVDYKAREALIESNVLGFDIINLYAARINVEDWMIIMARDFESARGYALNVLGALPKIIQMPKEKWLTEFYFPNTKQTKSLADIRKESTVFPKHILI